LGETATRLFINAGVELLNLLRELQILAPQPPH